MICGSCSIQVEEAAQKMNSEDIARQTRDFRRQGGRVEQVRQGATGMNQMANKPKKYAHEKQYYVISPVKRGAE